MQRAIIEFHFFALAMASKDLKLPMEGAMAVRMEVLVATRIQVATILDITMQDMAG